MASAGRNDNYDVKQRRATLRFLADLAPRLMIATFVQNGCTSDKANDVRLCHRDAA
jgi:hypothetical protein